MDEQPRAVHGGPHVDDQEGERLVVRDRPAEGLALSGVLAREVAGLSHDAQQQRGEVEPRPSTRPGDTRAIGEAGGDRG